MRKGLVSYDNIVESSDERVVLPPISNRWPVPVALRVGFGERVGISKWQKQVCPSRETGVAYGHKDLKTRGS